MIVKKDKQQKNNLVQTKKSIQWKLQVPLMLILIVQTSQIMFIFYREMLPQYKSNLYDQMVMQGETITQNIEMFVNDMDQLEQEVIKERKLLLKELVKIQFQIVENKYEMYKQGKFKTEEEQKKQQVKQLQSFRFFNDKSGYYFINDTNGIVIYNPKTSIIGKNLINQKDPDGVPFMKLIIKQQLNGGGYVKYKWSKSGSKEPEFKISYQEYFQPWDWVIGTGIYIDDIEKEVNKQFNKELEKLRENIMKIRIGKSGYPFILQEDGTVILYIKREMEGKKIHFKDQKTGEDLMNLFMINKNKFVEYYYTKPNQDGIYKKIQYVGWIPKKKWYLILTVYEDDIMQQVEQFKKIFIQGMTGQIILILFIIWFVFKKQLIKYLNEQNEFQNRVSSGDFTQSINSKQEDEIGVLINQLEVMKENIKQMLIKILNQSNKLLKEKDKVQNQSNQIKDKITLTEQVQTEQDSFQNDVQQQIEETTQSIEEVQSSQQNVSNQQQDLSHISEEFSNRVIEGSNKVIEINKKLEQFKVQMNKQQDTQKKLENEQQEIDKIVENIQSIQEQTNLLQLNQQIEQQRQGEQGRGFQVVQDEIRKLQQENQSLNDSIRKILGEIKQGIDNIQNISISLQEEQNQIQENSNEIQNQFEEFKEQQNNLNSMQENLVQTQEEQSQQSEEIQQQMDNQSKKVQDLSDKIQDVQSEIKDLENEYEQLHTSVKVLNEISDEFQREIQKFKFEEN